MSSDDSELERLKARRLAEMQKNISHRERSGTVDGPKAAPTRNARDIILPRLGYRGLEVLENAESQFPTETRLMVQRLSELVESGELRDVLDGGSLLAIFRLVGLHVRMKTKINVEQDGKFVSLSDKLRSESQDGDA